MGYRSEVKSLIYGSPEEIKAFKLANFDLYNQVAEDFGTDITNQRNDEYEIIYLSLGYVKWYDEYKEVQHWHEFLQLALLSNLSIEFVRVGEELGDVEVDNGGESCEYYLEVVQQVNAHFDR
jgi:hypothetical protein